MGDPAKTVELFGLTFNVANILSGLLAMTIVFLVVFFLSRRVQMKPGKGQNVLEWLIDFTNGIVRSQSPGPEGDVLTLYSFVLFLFLIVANVLGLLVQVKVGGYTYIKSPTADPVITMTFAMMSLTFAHFNGISRLGVKNFFKNAYLKPFPALMPIELFEEFSNFLTLSLRLFGNIFAGEVLLKLVGQLAFSHGIYLVIPGVILEILWQGFSLFIGAIQAFVFVTLSNVYVSQKSIPEE